MIVDIKVVSFKKNCFDSTEWVDYWSNNCIFTKNITIFDIEGRKHDNFYRLSLVETICLEILLASSSYLSVLAILSHQNSQLMFIFMYIIFFSHILW